MLVPRPSVQVLASLRLFEDIDPADLGTLAASLAVRRYRAGEVIFHQGDPGDSLHVIVSGAVRRVLPSPNGDDAILVTLRRQALFGVLSLLDHGPQATTAIAVEATETINVPRAVFMDLISAHGCAREVLLATLATDVRRLTNRVESLYFLDVPGRLADVLVGLSLERGRPLDPGASTPAGAVRIDGRLTQGDLAAMVNSSRQSVNQALAEMGAGGIVRFERDGIVILDPDRLASLARL